MEYIFYVSTSSISLGTMIATITNTSVTYVPIYCLAFYLSAIPTHIMGGRIFWNSTMILAILSIGILLVYCLGCLEFVNSVNLDSTATTGGETNAYFIGGFESFLMVLPLTAWYEHILLYIHLTMWHMI